MSNDAFLIIKQYWDSGFTGAGQQYWNIGEGNIPLLTGTGTGHNDVITLSTDCNIPYLDMEEWTGNVSGVNALPALNYGIYNNATGYSSVIGGTDGAYAISGYNPGYGLTLFALTIAAIGYQGLHGYLAEEIPVFTFSATSGFWSFGSNITIVVPELDAHSGAIGDLDISNPTEDNVPVVSMSASGKLSAYSSLDSSIPVIDVTATAKNDIDGIYTVSVPRVTITATGKLSLVGSLDVDLPDMTVVSAGRNNLLGSLSVTLPKFVLTDTTKIKVNSSVAVILPALEIELSAYIVPIGTGSMSIPSLNTNKSCAVAGRFEYPVPTVTSEGTNPYTLEYRRQ